MLNERHIDALAHLEVYVKNTWGPTYMTIKILICEKTT
jgi:hypothetical protein